MQLELTAEEQNQLIWEEGDYFEIVPGMINVTSVYKEAPSAQYPGVQPLTNITFFFDCLDNSWGDQEWNSRLANDVPNGPALLVLLRRGDVANVFGVVSMVNGAWSMATPLLAISLYRSSKAGKKFMGNEILLVVVGTCLFISGLICVIAPFALLGYLIPPIRERYFQTIKNFKGKDPNETTAAGRALMHRIAKYAPRYWPNNSDTGGRL